MKTVPGIDYGREAPWTIEVPGDAIVVDGADPDRIPPALEDIPGAVRDAVRNPLGMTPLSELVDSSSKVTIAINDWVGVMVYAVPVVLEELARAGVDERNVEIIVAGGMHPKVTRSQMYVSRIGSELGIPYPSAFHVLPPEVVDRFWPTGWAASRIRPHDSSDPSQLVDLGTTEFGELVEMNRCVVDSDLVIYVGGWTGVPNIWALGGAAGVTVGLGSARSIMDHHSWRVHEHQDSMTSDAHKQLFRKRKEAIAAHVEEATGKKVFYVEAAINARWEFTAVYAGDGATIRATAFDHGYQDKVVEIPEQVDVFVSGGPYWGVFYDTINNPAMALMTINRYIREFEGDKPPLREGGVAIMVTPTDGTITERWRPADLEILRLYAKLGHDLSRLQDYEQEFNAREDLLSKYRYSNAAHPMHPFPVMYGSSLITRQASRIIFAGCRNPEAAALVGATAAPTWEDAWALACKSLGTRDPSVMVTPNVGSRTPLQWRVLS